MSAQLDLFSDLDTEAMELYIEDLSIRQMKLLPKRKELERQYRGEELDREMLKLSRKWDELQAQIEEAESRLDEMYEEKEG